MQMQMVLNTLRKGNLRKCESGTDSACCIPSYLYTV